MFYIPPSHIFHPDDAAKLEASGLITPVDENGFRKIHKRRLYLDPGWCEVYFEFPLDARPDTHPEAFSSFPDQIISKATIICCGFTEEKAEESWHQYENWPVVDWPHKMDRTFLDYILEVVQFPRAIYDEDDAVWTKAMDGWGISAKVQNAIMDPEFSGIRHTYTCNDIIRENVANCYGTLTSLRNTSHARAAGKRPSYPDRVLVGDEILPLTEWMERQGIGLEDL
uniref:WGS project CBMI000000000 data, contig CS3069_c001925 n=1 Tax=Fusarium clavum TaxID=2594811 RepID=A0A090MC58_9HYPO|nr:unnamed protein product [Fusarium clavum]CEG05821.1 unnamed protein product [Fusarium clavum]